MLDLAENKRLRPEEQKRLIWAFDQLQLPLPTGDQYYNGGSKITFVTPAAVTIRLVNNSNIRLVRHLNIARPLGAIALSKRWRLDIIQGGETSVTQQEAKNIRTTLTKEGFNVSDIGENEGDERNCFRIAKRKKFSLKGFPVAYDFHVLTLRAKHSLASNLLIRTKPYAWVYDTRPQEGQIRDIQDQEYGDLRDAFMASWKKTNDGKTLVIPDIMDNFWKSCIQAKSEGRTVASWCQENSCFPPSQAQRLANYERRLKLEAPSFQ
jgi:hypothetical protein